MNRGPTIGEVSRRTGVPAKTIRYYESIDLIPAPERGSNGYRLYGDHAVQLLRFVKRARDDRPDCPILDDLADGPRS